MGSYEITHEEIEKVADFMHNQWIHWMKYLLSTMRVLKYNIQYNEWKRLMRTKYKDLTEKEKESDREWAIKLLRLIKTS